MSKHEYIEKLKHQLAEWEVDIERLESKMDQAQDDYKEKLDKTLADLKHKRAELKEKFDKLEGAAEEAWEDIKEGLELAWDSLKLGFLSAKSEFMDRDKQDD